MLKAVKECMKNWLATHERLYWYIVFGLAVLAFGIITALGCAKLEKAEAAEGAVNPATLTYDGTCSDRMAAYLPLYEHFNYVIVCDDSDSDYDFYHLFSEKPSLYVRNGNIAISSSYTGLYAFLPVKNGVVTNAVVYSSLKAAYEIESSERRYLASNYDVGLSGYTYNHVYFGATEIYSLDAPYTTFQNVIINMDIQNDMLIDFYNDYMSNSTWKYFGHLNNRNEALDVSYKMDASYVVQLPTVDYFLGLFAKNDVDFDIDSNITVANSWGIWKHLSDMRDSWYADSKAPYVEYEFQYLPDIVPDANGNFTYQFSFLELETLLKYWNPELLTEFQGYSEDFRALYMTFAHVECVTSTIKTEREGLSVYGKVTTNRFNRGIYDACVEVIPEVDINTATPEEIDKIVTDATKEAQDAYMKELEDKIESLEGQLGDASDIDTGFGGNLDTTDLWSSFINLVKGLGTIAPAIAELSFLSGIVLGFLPLEIGGIMGTTILALCIIAIIKAIRG